MRSAAATCQQCLCTTEAAEQRWHRRRAPTCAGIWWYIGTVHQPRTLQDYRAVVAADGPPPPSWVYHYSGLGHAQLWADEVPIGSQYLFSFYWVASTLSASALVGNTTPKNIAEVVFTVACAPRRVVLTIRPLIACAGCSNALES